jgi:hypothetical protein
VNPLGAALLAPYVAVNPMSVLPPGESAALYEALATLTFCPGLRCGAGPQAADLLVTAEGPPQGPAVDGGGPGVGDLDVRLESAAPGVGDRTGPAR